MTRYQINKEKARDQAKFWQNEFAERSYFWGEIAEWADFFTKLGKRYGLLKEFRENGII